MSVNYDDLRCDGCEDYILYEKLVELNKAQGDEIWPLDVEWRSCLNGPDYWLNCRRRRK
jgi:hypothetical protein